MVDERSLIRDSLQASGHYSRVVGHGIDRNGEVNRVRSLARQVAREQGWKITTLVVPTDYLSNPAVDAVVHAMIPPGGTSPLHEQLLESRREKTMRRAVEGIDLP